MTIWFSSDHHFGHANVIKYANRPFQSVIEMDTEMTARWNYVVKPGDDVYYLGDLSFHQPSVTHKLLSKLNGNIHFVQGNHDKKTSRDNGEHFAWIKDYYELKHDKQLVVLCHYALRTWRNQHHGSWNLHGHSHGTLKELPGYKQYDVGVDANDFYPVSFERIKDIMSTRVFVPIDHHGEVKDES